jgi:type VI secretion system Hcp family effector
MSLQSLPNLLPILLLAAMLWGTPASATTFFSIDGAFQGHITGDAVQQGEEGNIEVVSVSHEIYILYDQVTGLPTGERQHTPLLATKLFDAASVPLLLAATTEEPLQVTIHFYRYTPTPELYYQIQLMNAFLVQANQATGEQDPPLESYAFVYQTIAWHDPIHVLEASAQWEGSTAYSDDPAAGAPREPLTQAMPSPNPTRAGTVVWLDVPVSSRVELDVFDINGRHIRELFQDAVPGSRSRVRWDGRDQRGEPVAAGVYLVKLDWPEGSAATRVTVIR